MPIKFLKHEHRQYFTAKWESIIYDFELVSSCEKFYADFEKSGDWDPEIPELVDIIGADLSQVTQTGIKNLAQWSEALHRGHGISEKKTAIVLPPEGLSVPALFYEFWTEASPELVRLFRTRSKAIGWLTE